jgi:hypothetical protein
MTTSGNTPEITVADAPLTASAGAGYHLLVQAGSSEAFPLGKAEVDRICRRLRGIVAPVLSHETWAATLFGASLGLFIAWTSLPSSSTAAKPADARHAAYLHGAYLVGWIAALVIAAILASLAIADRRRNRTSEAHLIADELQEICDERLAKPDGTR